MLALNIDGLFKEYSNGFIALDNINLHVSEKSFFALLGPNGAGKSTIIGIISSLINKTSGTINVFGHDLDRHVNMVKRCIGLVPQEINFNLFETVYDIVIDQAGYYGISRNQAKHNVEKYLKILDLWDKRDHPSRNLSGGMKRRVMVARALIHQPKLLILDEPTAGVDIELRRSMWDFLKELNNSGTTIILTTHYLEEAEYLCNDVAIIDKGKILNNTSIKGLIKSINKSVMLIEFDNEIGELPNVDNYTISKLDPFTIEVTFEKKYGLNGIVSYLLNSSNVNIVSIRNKHNALEEIFLQLINK